MSNRSRTGEAVISGESFPVKIKIINGRYVSISEDDEDGIFCDRTYLYLTRAQRATLRAALNKLDEIEDEDE